MKVTTKKSVHDILEKETKNRNAMNGCGAVKGEGEKPIEDCLFESCQGEKGIRILTCRPQILRTEGLWRLSEYCGRSKKA